MVREFRTTFNLPISDVPAVRPNWRLHHKLLAEEVAEFYDAGVNADLVGQLDALADIVYVAYGAALELGLPLDDALRVVHESNMAKLGPDGKPIVRSDGKVLKPEGWRPPNLAALL